MVPAVRSKVIGDVVAALLSSGAHTATKYLEPGLVVRVTRPTYEWPRPSPKRNRRGKVKLNGAGKRDTRVEVHVTIGEPNHEAREFIKRCDRADEPFPVKKIQLQFLPAKK